MDKIAVLIPCYNESKTIKKVVEDYKRILPEATIYVYDNNSSDGTDEIARKAGAVVRYEYQQGKGNVIRRMFREIDAECYIMTDGDDTYPAENAKEAIQWLYFGYLGAVKDQNGAAMSIGRTSTFLDIYIERDLKNGTLTEEQAQELMDHFIMKLRLVRFLRTPEYNELFSGDPVWVTESIGGMGIDGRTLVTKNSYRVLHTLENLGPAPEPNLTVLWSTRLPEGFKRYTTDSG